MPRDSNTMPEGGAVKVVPDRVAAPRMSIAALRAIAQPREYSPSPTDRPYRAISIYLSAALAQAPGLGHGHGPLNHFPVGLVAHAVR